MDKSKTDLYSFFVSEKYHSDNELVIQIDETLNTFEAICNHVGEAIYKDCPDKNGIKPGTYFGGNYASFSDCLGTYFLCADTNVSIRFNILDKGSNVSDKEIYNLLDIFCFSHFHFDLKNRLRVYISKKIMEVYLRESDRLLNLDIDLEDMFHPEVGDSF